MAELDQALQAAQDRVDAAIQSVEERVDAARLRADEAKRRADEAKRRADEAQKRADEALRRVAEEEEYLELLHHTCTLDHLHVLGSFFRWVASRSDSTEQGSAI